MKPPPYFDRQAADGRQGVNELSSGHVAVAPRPGLRLEAGFLRYAWLPIPLFALAIVALWIWDLPGVVEPPYLLPILNFTFRTATGGLVAYLAARSFSRNASLPILLLGCGMLFFAACSLVSGLAVHYQQVNVGVTVYNTGMCLAGICHVLAVMSVVSVDERLVRHARLVVSVAYTLVLLTVGVLTYAAMVGATPLFIAPDEGATPLRQTVLGSGVGLFAFAAIVVGSVARRRAWTFGRWYAVAMGLFALGLFAVLIGSHIGDALGWLGRAAMYLGGLYMLGAALLASSKNGEWDAVLHAALRESEQRFRALAEATFEGIAISENGIILDTNERLARMLGYDLDDVIGRPFSDFTPADDAAIVMEAMCSQRDITLEHQMIRKDGTRITVETHGRTHVRDRKSMRFSAIRDISDRKQQEQALRESRDELERRVAERTAELEQRAKQLAYLTSELTLTEQRERRRLAQVLHDHLQQLLVGIKYGMEGIARHVPEDQHRTLRDVNGLLNESINVSRSLTVELSPPILHEAGLAAGLEWLARWIEEKHGLKVELRTDSTMTVDREDVRLLIFQAVRELLFNVAKHANVPQASVSLTQQDDQHLCATVKDVGAGFEPESIFGGGDRLAGGFGLFSIRERLELLGGAFHVESAPGRGTCITLIAPLWPEGAVPPSHPLAPAAREVMQQSATPAPLRSPERASPTRSRRDKIRLLLADDHAVMRQGLSSLLAEESAIEIVGEAADGEEAIEMAWQLRPDVILMDFSMPKVDGVQATRTISAELPETRIIGLSMYDEADRSQAMLDAGAVAYATKSGRTDALLATILATAEPGRPTARLADAPPPTPA